MDEREVVNRREAVAGLSLLGSLMLLLAGTIFYRIVSAEPAARRALSTISIATDSSEIVPPSSGETSERSGEWQTGDDAAVRAASHGQERVSPAETTAQPRFLAPAGR